MLKQHPCEPDYQGILYTGSFRTPIQIIRSLQCTAILIMQSGNILVGTAEEWYGVGCATRPLVGSQTRDATKHTTIHRTAPTTKTLGPRMSAVLRVTLIEILPLGLTRGILKYYKSTQLGATKWR